MAGSSIKSLDDYQFTFEAYLQDSARIEADPTPSGDVMDSESLSESIANYHEEFGRTFHSYHSGSYHFPNDPTEIERLDYQHEVLRIVLDDRNHLAPFSRANPPKRVLDIATGTGKWAVEMGDEYPESQIVGTDLSPIQPGYVPPNVRFFVEDSSEDWDYTQKFDYVHTRMTLGCWTDMKTQIIQQAYDNLEPGGWFEAQEVFVHPFSDDGTLSHNCALAEWVADIARASEAADRSFVIGDQMRTWMLEAGFEDVHEMVYRIPMNGWPKGRALKQIGMMWQRNLLNGLGGFSLGLLNRFGGRTVEDIELQLVQVRKDLFNQQIHAYQKFYVVYGRKPLHAVG